MNILLDSLKLTSRLLRNDTLAKCLKKSSCYLLVVSDFVGGPTFSGIKFFNVSVAK